MKRILFTVMISFLATGVAVAQEPTKRAKKSSEAELQKKKAEYEKIQKAKIEADKNRQSNTASPKNNLDKAAALTVENKNQ